MGIQRIRRFRRNTDALALHVNEEFDNIIGYLQSIDFDTLEQLDMEEINALIEDLEKLKIAEQFPFSGEAEIMPDTQHVLHRFTLGFDMEVDYLCMTDINGNEQPDLSFVLYDHTNNVEIYNGSSSNILDLLTEPIAINQGVDLEISILNNSSVNTHEYFYILRIIKPVEDEE